MSHPQTTTRSFESRNGRLDTKNFRAGMEGLTQKSMAFFVSLNGLIDSSRVQSILGMLILRSNGST